MKNVLKRMPHNVSFKLNGEHGPFRLVMDKDTRTRGETTEVYIAPFVNGRLFTDRGKWIDWNTEAEEVE